MASPEFSVGQIVAAPGALHALRSQAKPHSTSSLGTPPVIGESSTSTTGSTMSFG